MTLLVVVVVAVLAAHNLGVERLPAVLYVPVCLCTTTVLVWLARVAGIGAGEIGPTPAGLGAGMGLGVAVALLVATASLVPVTRHLFADRRMAGVGRLGTAYRALVRIPLGTVTLEEVAFRAVLLALLDRLVPLGWAVVASCLLFGLWHVVPVRATLRTNDLPAGPAVIGAAVVAAGLAGAGLCWLRLATGGLAAPMLVHASASAAATVVAAAVLHPPDWTGDRHGSRTALAGHGAPPGRRVGGRGSRHRLGRPLPHRALRPAGRGPGTGGGGRRPRAAKTGALIARRRG